MFKKTFFVFLIYLTGCTSYTNIEIPEVENLPIFYVTISPDKKATAFVSQTYKLESQDSAKALTDVRIEMYVNNEFAEELQFDSTRHYSSTILGVPEKKYSFRLYSAEYEAIEISGSIPNRPSILNISTKAYKTIQLGKSVKLYVSEIAFLVSGNLNQLVLNFSFSKNYDLNTGLLVSESMVSPRNTIIGEIADSQDFYHSPYLYIYLTSLSGDYYEFLRQTQNYLDYLEEIGPFETNRGLKPYSAVDNAIAFVAAYSTAVDSVSVGEIEILE